MKKYIAIAILLVMTLGFYSCHNEDPLLKAARENALKQDTYGVFEGEKAIFAYDDDKHQLAYNTSSYMCRFQNDAASKVIQMNLDDFPEKGATRKLTLKTRGLPSIGKSCNVEVLKISPEESKVWLLDHESLMSFIMYYEFH